MRALLIIAALLLAPRASSYGQRKGIPETPEQRAASVEMYRREVSPILAKIEKSLLSKSVKELFAMLAENNPILANATPGSYAEFLPAETSNPFLYYYVCRDGNQLVVKELTKRVATNRNAFQEYKNDPNQKHRSVFTGSAGPPLSTYGICNDLLETGKSSW